MTKGACILLVATNLLRLNHDMKELSELMMGIFFFHETENF